MSFDVQQDGKELLEYITEAMKKAVEDVFDAAIEQATRDAQAKRDEAVAKIMVRMSSHMSIENLGQTIRIEIKKPEGEL